jgi:hypothetical protein
MCVFLTLCSAYSAYTNGCVGLKLLVSCLHVFAMCTVLLSAGVVWILCVCVGVYIYDVEYEILEVK